MTDARATGGAASGGAAPNAAAPGGAARSWSPEATFAIEAVRMASRLCRAVRRDFDHRLAVAKDDRSPVTIADLGAQALVSTLLANAFPGEPLMAEEDARQLADRRLAGALRAALESVGTPLDDDAIAGALSRGHDAGGPGRRWWTLDPVDGTKGFLRDEQYAVALALVERGQPQVAVLGCPNLPGSAGGPTGCLFVAEREGGAWELPLDDPAAAPRPIAVDPTPDIQRARLVESVEASHSSLGASAAIADRLGLTRPPLRMDSQAKYGVVARGEANLYLRIPHGEYRENVWDHAAGLLVVEEAGGVVTDVDGRPLDLTTGRRMTANRGVTASSAILYEQVIDAVRATVGAA